MSSVTVNKVGLDLVDIEVRQVGRASTDMFFQDPVLDFTRDYVIGVSELSVPLSQESMLSQTASNNVLMRIKPRLPPPATVHGNIAPLAGPSSLELSRMDIRTPGQFFQSIKDFCTNFTNYDQGTGGARELSAEISMEGLITFRGNADFWFDRYIEFSPYGAEIMCLNTQYVHITALAGGAFSRVPEHLGTAAIAEGVPGGVFRVQQGGVFLGGGRMYDWRGVAPCLRKLEHRMRVEIDADLSVPHNILMEDGVQKMHYNIGSFAFPSNIVLSYDLETGNRNTIAPYYGGRTIIKSKETPTTDWHRLLSTANVQNMRLHVFIVRREYDPATRSWQLVRNELKIQDDEHWDATLKFVQTF